MRNQGRDPEAGWLQHSRLGFNYRLSDINCAVGVAQMTRLDEILAARSRVAAWYSERFAGESRLSMQSVPAHVEMSWFVMVVRLSDDYSQEDRDRLLGELRGIGIQCSNYFTPIHLQPFYQQMGFHEGQFPITEALSARTVALPFHHGVSESDVDRVVSELTRRL